jgi:lysozyme
MHLFVLWYSRLIISQRDHRMNKKLTGGILAAALALIAANEGLKTEPYRDIGGVLTDCYGRTKGVEIGVELTKEQCDEELMIDIIAHAKPIEALDMKLPDGVIIAWADFCYNVGVGACQSSTGYKMLKRGDITGACDQLLRWKYAAGLDCSVRSNNCYGVWKRRLEEHRLCTGN